ncbi:acyltransferase [Proteinivorax hydrogeniformans]|uniref:Acyltransferase n=1 Tax=Proteinivorax hydrogeniformans TaxID=1826727 RepID=A0AAU8HW96_9FIRM
MSRLKTGDRETKRNKYINRRKVFRMLINHPVILVNLFYSMILRVFLGLNPFKPLQLVVDWRSRVKRKGNAKVNINGQLFVGGRYITNLSSSSANVVVFPGGQLEINGRVKLGPGVQIVVAKGGKLVINDCTYITADAKIFCSSEIIIGRNTAISWGTSIIDSDFHKLFYKGKKDFPEKIKIGDHVWIGCNSTILKGTTIEDNSVIAAGATITKDVPSNVLVAGNPAKVVKKDVMWI